MLISFPNEIFPSSFNRTLGLCRSSQGDIRNYHWGLGFKVLGYIPHHIALQTIKLEVADMSPASPKLAALSPNRANALIAVAYVTTLPRLVDAKDPARP